MNIIEKQTELTKSLYEINTSTMKELASLQRENLEKYFEMNRTFGERLPEVKNVSDFMALQREYGETVVSNSREAIQTQNEIVRGAVEETTEALRTAFTFETASSKPAPKTKAKAKKPATTAQASS
ncbi:MAG: phasin family protein [Gammaproteobacteria bacterium]|nr:phasin family protein [Gammaproteobacteria bacterium]